MPKKQNSLQICGQVSSISASEGSEHEGENEQTQNPAPAPEPETADSPQVLWRNENGNQHSLIHIFMFYVFPL